MNRFLILTVSFKRKRENEKIVIKDKKNTRKQSDPNDIKVGTHPL